MTVALALQLCVSILRKDLPNPPGKCPPFCDFSNDPCGKDVDVCKDCYLCKGEATNSILTSLPAKVTVFWCGASTPKLFIYIHTKTMRTLQANVQHSAMFPTTPAVQISKCARTVPFVQKVTQCINTPISLY